MPLDSTEPERIRRRVVYHGRVQGVGFRFTTASIARRFPVVGYVKNLRDRTVELVVEAEAEIVREFLGEISADFQGNITDCADFEDESTERFRTFGIRY